MQHRSTPQASNMELLANKWFEPLACQLLEPCNKDVADKASEIRKHLKAHLGRWQAGAVLSLYKEVCLRHKGVCSRYLKNHDGKTLKLRSLDVNAAVVING
jgi:hypothetical protein